MQINSLKHSQHIIKFSKFILIGGLAFAINWGIYLLSIYFLNSLKIYNYDYQIGLIIGYLLSGIFNLVANTKFTFSEQLTKEKSIKFIIGFSLGLLLTYLLNVFFVEKLHVSKYFSLPIVSIIVLFFTFTFHSKITFKK